MRNPVLPEEAMARAIALSQEAISNGSGPPFGAVIVKEGAIVGEGFNHVVKRRAKGTPDRRRRGTPFSDMMGVC